MHEFSIATQLLENVLEFVESRGPSTIRKVRIEIGELMCVEAEQLRFCYDSIKADTVLKDSALEIETVPAIVHCPRCKYRGPAKYWEGELWSASIPTLQCPDCGGAAQAVQGHDCAIKSIQMVDSRKLNAPELTTDHKNTHDECDPFAQWLSSEA